MGKEITTFISWSLDINVVLVNPKVKLMRAWITENVESDSSGNACGRQEPS